MSYQNIKPLGERILIQPIERASKTSGGIILPEVKQEQEKCVEGKVIALGEGKKENGVLQPITSVSIGDKVLYSKWSGSELKNNKEVFVIVNESDILAKINQ